MTRALTLLVAICWAAPAAAADARLVVDFEAAKGSPRWYAAALEQLVTKEASRFSRVAIADKIDLSACPGRDPDCVVQRYAAAGVDIVVLGTLDGDALAWAVHETWSFARVVNGRLAVGGANITVRRVEHGVA